MAILQTAVYTNMPKYISQYYYADRSFAAKTVSVAADRHTLVSPQVIGLDIGGLSLDLSAVTSIDLSVAANWDSQSPTDYCVANNRKGRDFYVYGVWPSNGGTSLALLLSANSTYPAGYDATNSRKLGGFHCLCGDVTTKVPVSHPAYGYVGGDIVPTSVWDLKFRCESGANEGLHYDAKTQLWDFIYMASNVGGIAASVFGGTIWDNVNWMDANDACHLAKMRLPRDNEFTSIAYGSNEATNITGSADPGTTGNHVDTSNRRMISATFAEDCCGVEWHWLDEHSYQYTGSAVFGWVTTAGSKGKVNIQGSYDVKLLAGGYWTDGARCGSRGRYAHSWRWYSDATIGFRAVGASQTK